MPMGTMTLVLSRKIDQPTLEQAQKFVGGYIEIVTTTNGDQIVINEEGKLSGMALNEDATDFAHLGQAIMPHDYIAGNAMILTGEARLD